MPPGRRRPGGARRAAIPPTAVLTCSPLVRGIATLINWFTPKAMRAFPPEDLEAAVRHLTAQDIRAELGGVLQHREAPGLSLEEPPFQTGGGAHRPGATIQNARAVLRLASQRRRQGREQLARPRQQRTRLHASSWGVLHAAIPRRSAVNESRTAGRGMGGQRTRAVAAKEGLSSPPPTPSLAWARHAPPMPRGARATLRGRTARRCSAPRRRRCLR